MQLRLEVEEIHEPGVAVPITQLENWFGADGSDCRVDGAATQGPKPSVGGPGTGLGADQISNMSDLPHPHGKAERRAAVTAGVALAVLPPAYQLDELCAALIGKLVDFARPPLTNSLSLRLLHDASWSNQQVVEFVAAAYKLVEFGGAAYRLVDLRSSRLQTR